MWPPAVRTAAIVTRGPYLQTGTPTSAIVRWRTDTRDRQPRAASARTRRSEPIRARRPVTTEHEVRLTGLQPETRYYYSVGTTTGTLAGGIDFTFMTAPVRERRSRPASG